MSDELLFEFVHFTKFKKIESPFKGILFFILSALVVDIVNKDKKITVLSLAR